MPTTLVYRIETKTTRMGPWKDYHGNSNGPDIVVKNPNLRFGTSLSGIYNWFEIAAGDINLNRYYVAVYRVRGGVVQSPRLTKGEHKPYVDDGDWRIYECVFDPKRAKRIATIKVPQFRKIFKI